MRIPGGLVVLARCTKLVVEKNLGEADATRCGAYESRFSGMKIELVAPTGDRFGSECTPEFPTSTEGVHLDCSYRWSGEKQPAYIQIAESTDAR